MLKKIKPSVVLVIMAAVLMITSIFTVYYVITEDSEQLIYVWQMQRHGARAPILKADDFPVPLE